MQDFFEKGRSEILADPANLSDQLRRFPVSVFSSFAGNPYFIDLEYLCKEKLLTKKECESFSWGTNPQYVDYGQMYVSRYPLLKKAYDRFRKNEPEDFAAFCKDEAEWLDEYALFNGIKRC